MKRRYIDPLARVRCGSAKELLLFDAREIEAPNHAAKPAVATASISKDAGEAPRRSAADPEILELCKQPGGVTIDEAAVALGEGCREVRQRFASLEKEGLIGRAAITRPTRRGERADVWKVLPALGQVSR